MSGLMWIKYVDIMYVCFLYICIIVCFTIIKYSRVSRFYECAFVCDVSMNVQSCVTFP